jgi:hypothetical protein
VGADALFAVPTQRVFGVELILVHRDDVWAIIVLDIENVADCHFLSLP